MNGVLASSLSNQLYNLVPLSCPEILHSYGVNALLLPEWKLLREGVAMVTVLSCSLPAPRVAPV